MKSLVVLSALLFTSALSAQTTCTPGWGMRCWTQNHSNYFDVRYCENNGAIKADGKLFATETGLTSWLADDGSTFKGKGSFQYEISGPNGSSPYTVTCSPTN